MDKQLKQRLRQQMKQQMGQQAGRQANRNINRNANNNNSEGKRGRRRFRRRIAVTGAKLKIYACISLLFYSTAMSVVQNGIIQVDKYPSGEELKKVLAADPDLMIVSGWASVLQLLGGLSVPVFAFLLVEGFQKTSSFSRYLVMMLACAVVSELPYDFAMKNSFFDFSSQNALFTMSLCLVMLYGLRYFDEGNGKTHRVVQIFIVLATVFWSSVLRCSFSLCTVLLVAVYYLLRDHKGIRLLVGSVISIMYVTGPLSTYVLHNYGGQRGWNKNKVLFYIFYPMHLLVLGSITYCLRM